jgi:hypothetical protein
MKETAVPHSTHGYVQGDKLFLIRKKTIGPRRVTISGAIPDRMGVQ